MGVGLCGKHKPFLRPHSAKLAEVRTWVQAYFSAVSSVVKSRSKGVLARKGASGNKDSHLKGVVSGNQAKNRKFTYLFEIVISQASGGAPTPLSGHAAALLTTTGGTEIGSVGTALRLGGL